ncbi:MAG: class I SAM-dependent methyltransferase [Mucilaginibacter sp.]|uniref:O-methyltransferase n=1 Tax=Mucilaginibacter sp. TaxID=1882438 RepID=UPI0032672B29
MTDQVTIDTQPVAYPAIKEDTERHNFTMPSETLTCSLLRTLAASKPAGRFLELGTGTGLSAAWILDGMDRASKLTSIDNNVDVLIIAQKHLKDNRLTLICADGNDWITDNSGNKYDFIFADAWPGKYHMLNETLAMLNKGGMYIIDDMLPQPNWPAGHQELVNQLIVDLEECEDLIITKQNWASGIVICVKK